MTLPPEQSEALLALAARCESARGRDKQLGREILLACGHGFVSPLYAWHDPTASTEVALSLSPIAGMMMLDMEFTCFPSEPGVWPAASVRWYPPRAKEKDWHAMVVTAATLPLTICAAALRSLALQPGGE